MIGAVFAHYRVTAKIGEGGMGEVFRATDTKLDREVALKVLPADVAGDPDRVARFEREAKVLASLNHPNIAQLYGLETAAASHPERSGLRGRGGDGSPEDRSDALDSAASRTSGDPSTRSSDSPAQGDMGETTFLVMELLEGDSLRERLAEGAMPFRKVAEIGAAIARGLGAAHDRGIVHRDIKPENVFLTEDGQIKVLDFGLATDADARAGNVGDTKTPTVTQRTGPGAVLGTVGYMAPEQVRGDRADPRTDIFALGAVLYELVTGRRAFDRETAPETMTAILREEPPEPTELGVAVPPALDRVIRRCLEKRPEERYQSARDLAFHLDALASGSGSASGIAERATSAPRGGRRLSAWVTVGLAVVAAALGAAAAAWFFSSGAPDELDVQRLTYRRGMVWSARFTPDAQSVVYGAAWENDPLALFMGRFDNPESRVMDLGAADILSISRTGEMALSLGRRFLAGWESSGTLATAPLVGSAPRPVLEGVAEADWSPDGASLAVVRDVDGRVRLEYPIGTVLHETDGWLSNLRISPDGQHVAVVDHPFRGDNVGRVMVVGIDGVVQVFDDSNSQGLAWAPAGDELWSSSGRHLVAWNLSGERRTIYTSFTHLWLQDIAPDGRALLSSTSIRRELVGRAPGENAERNLSWFDWSSPQTLSRDGRTVLFDEQNMGNQDGYFVYIRGTDGSPPVRIGTGTGRALSPDGRWALTVFRPFTDPRWVLLPTGAGESRELADGLVRNRLWAGWMPDGDRLIVAGSEPGGALGLYVRGVDSADERLLTPDGVEYHRSGYPVSPDGAWVAARPIGGAPVLYPVEGGEPREIPGLEASDTPVQWTADGREIYVYRSGEIPARVTIVDVESGERRPWRDLQPDDTAGVFGIDFLTITPDGEGYVYSYRRLLSTLFVFEGLR